jgi:predicted O-methyltransferase YrrM
MPLSRTYDIKLSLFNGYEDRLKQHSDIREYLPLFYEQAKNRPGCRVLELGTRLGYSTLAFLAGAAKSDGHVWSVDLDDVMKYPEGMMSWKNTSQWTFIRGSDLDPAVQEVVPLEIDILFIDTSHEYEHTIRELELYVPRVVTGGVVFCHDTHLINWPGLVWSELTPPVWKALNDFCAATGRGWKNLSGQYGLGIIQVGEKNADDQ